MSATTAYTGPEIEAYTHTQIEDEHITIHNNEKQEGYVFQNIHTHGT